ncbi:MAG: FHA domain-containing protein [Phycisphaerales bacterium]|nr:FHA domain-containing protein [Phycisphaerales bacterium]
MNVKLVIFKPDGTRREIPVDAGRHLIGRTAEATLRIPLASVSRQHCEIVNDGQSLHVRDLGSSNGTYRNHSRVQESSLEPGDVLGVGPVMMTVQIDGQPAEIEPPSSTSSGDSSMMETPPAGVDTPTAIDDPDATLAKEPGVGNLISSGMNEDSSIFDFDFDFEDDDAPRL